ncbi:DNA/RNA non-specific endonuclease [Vagococcus sp. JNUCC 83]
MSYKKNKKNSTPIQYIIGLIVCILLVIAGVKSPDTLLDFLPFDNKETSQKTSETIKKDNPGPIEHGKSRFTSEELKNSSKGWIEYGKLDKLGRPTTANALIKPNMVNTGTSANQSIRPPGFISGLEPHNHSRGHLIGRQLGGTGDQLENLVTLYQNPVNTPYMTKYENMVRKAADSGETIRYRVAPIYQGNEPMPIAVDIEGRGLSKQSNIDFYVTIENKQ